jgi:hypothetical protein
MWLGDLSISYIHLGIRRREYAARKENEDYVDADYAQHYKEHVALLFHLFLPENHFRFSASDQGAEATRNRCQLWCIPQDEFLRKEYEAKG